MRRCQTNVDPGHLSWSCCSGWCQSAGCRTSRACNLSSCPTKCPENPWYNDTWYTKKVENGPNFKSYMSPRTTYLPKSSESCVRKRSRIQYVHPCQPKWALWLGKLLNDALLDGLDVITLLKTTSRTANKLFGRLFSLFFIYFRFWLKEGFGSV